MHARGFEIIAHDVYSVDMWTGSVYLCFNTIYAEMPRRVRLSYKKDRARKKRAARMQKKVCIILIHDHYIS